MALQLPSASNTASTVLGTIAGGLAASSAASWPFIISAAAALGMTPIALAGAVGIGVTALVNFGVTHVAQIKNLDELVSAWWPQIQKTYPTGKNGQTEVQPVAQGQANSNINHPVP